MTNDTVPVFFENLNPILQNFIRNSLKWRKFNKIQEEAIPIISQGHDTLLISPTASGKTEAVLIPVFDDILNNNLEPMSVLYISPLKALINDMDSRIEDWCKYFSLTHTRWHGDVSSSNKNKFIKEPTDFLSITPESLEVILMNKSDDEKKKIFKNLKYIVVDEIHNFLDGERGIQLNSILNRISPYCEKSIVKIGLSATVGNPKDIAEWLNYQEPARIVKVDQDPEFYYKVLSGVFSNIAKILRKYVNKEKILIFVQKRSSVESLNNDLQKKLNYNNILVHHSSIDGITREENESKFKSLPNGFMISTTTLELGIDIGDIFSVVQIGVPNTVSSFMQKIGRSGRSKNKKSKTIVFYESTPEIFLALAEIILGKKGEIENLSIVKKPYDIYFHQILSVLFDKGKYDKNELYNYLHNCYSFKNITLTEYNHLIEYLISTDILNCYGNFLSTGYNFEKNFGKMNYREFYSVFFPSKEYSVKMEKKVIGSVDTGYALLLKDDTIFTLAGKLWRVSSIDHKHFIIQVNPAKAMEVNIPRWDGDKPPLSYLISRKIYSILLNNFDRKLLNFNKSKFDDNSINKINKSIDSVRISGFSEGIIPVEFDNKSKKIYIYTFAGNKVNMLLNLIFKLYLDTYKLNCSPYYCSFETKSDCDFKTIKGILNNVKNILKDSEERIEITKLINKVYPSKFIKYLPDDLSLQLKYELYFDEEGLIDLCKNNQPKLIDESVIKNWDEKI